MRSAAAFVLTFVISVSVHAQRDTITILHLNDTHSNLAAVGPRDDVLEGRQGGIARAATIIGMTRSQHPGALLLHAGDVSIGDPVYAKYLAVAELRLLHALGVDAMTLGNHEFDLGPDALLQTLDSAFAAGAFTVLSANAIMEDPSVRGLKKHVAPSCLIKAGSHTVGVFGLTTPSANISSTPSPVVIDTNIAAVARAMVGQLSAKGAGIIVCLSHLGLLADTLLAKSVSGIDLIVGGHDHLALRGALRVRSPSGATTNVVQASSFYRCIGRVQMVADASGARLLSADLLPIDASIPAEPRMEASVRQLVAGVEETYGPLFTKKVGHVGRFLPETVDSPMVAGRKDTPVGNLLTDAYRAALRTQIGIEPCGSTAQPLYQGPIVAADLYRVVGYGYNADNGLGYHLATFSVRGSDLWKGIEFGLSQIDVDDEYMLQVSGMSYRYDPTRNPFDRVLSVTIAGRPLEPESTYTVATNEFVPAFLGALGIPISEVHACSADTTEFQLLMNAVAEEDTLIPVQEGRVEAVVMDAATKE